MDPATIAALIQGGTALYNTFGKNNPAKAAGRQLNQVQGFGREAYNPFIQQGQSAMSQLSPQYGQMAGNPTDYYNNILKGYQPSAGYQYQENKLNKAAGNTAAAGGFAGTDEDVRNRSEMIQGLLGGDIQQFLQNILGIQGMGQQGLQHQADVGYNASGNLADYLGTNAGNRANLSANQARYGNEGRSSALGSLASLIGSKQRPEGEQQMDFGELFKSLFGGGNGGSAPPAGSATPLNYITKMAGNR